MKRWSALAVAGAAVFLAAVATAHGDDGGADMDMHTDKHKELPAMIADVPADEWIISYFRHPEHGNLMLWHIALMSAGWAFVLPVAVVLNVAKSRYAVPMQILFHIVNLFGLLTGVVYNGKTPDLYKNNVHGSIGWVASLAAAAWMMTSLVALYARSFHGSGSSANGRRRSGQAITAALMAQYRRVTASPQQHGVDGADEDKERRWSGDSGQGTERNSASLYDHSRSSSLQSGIQLDDSDIDGAEKRHAQDGDDRHDDDDDEFEDVSVGDEQQQRRGFLSRVPAADRFLSRSVRKVAGFRRTMFAVQAVTVVLDRVILLLGFFGVTSGAVVYAGIFHYGNVFNGLAHFIKGGIFFWYGLLTFGRWMGCCADWGWGWNRRPGRDVVGKWAARVPSAEMLESFVICMYGVTNVGLEHLSNPGGEWAAIDLEHVSITLMFFGGGLLGMMVESSTIRDLMMTTIQLAGAEHGSMASARRPHDFEQPEQWGISLNPMPALMICLLGVMMGSHHQASMVSTMLHTQWGNMFMAFALARLATYAILYLRGPVGYLPQRPPTEVITSFCLVAGGLLFMLSNKDTVASLEYNDLDAMFVFNVTMGFTAFIMAWAAACMAIKGWAQRREARRVVAPMA